MPGWRVRGGEAALPGRGRAGLPPQLLLQTCSAPLRTLRAGEALHPGGLHCEPQLCLPATQAVGIAARLADATSTRHGQPQLHPADWLLGNSCIGCEVGHQSVIAVCALQIEGNVTLDVFGRMKSVNNALFEVRRMQGVSGLRAGHPGRAQGPPGWKKGGTDPPCCSSPAAQTWRRTACTQCESTCECKMSTCDALLLS